MNAVAAPAGVAQRPADSQPSIDDLDAAIRGLSRRINAATYRFLLLVREFDDRLGWSKWSFGNCAEWLAWRCAMSLSAAREKVRTAQALRDQPLISAAFADGRLSYSKVRALTRVAHLHDEQAMLAYALDATAAQVEERCRQLRNVTPESAREATRAWQARSLSIWRNKERNSLIIHVEVPIEEGELVAHALTSAVEHGDVAPPAEQSAASWHAQQADALIAIAKRYLAEDAGEQWADTQSGRSTSMSTADHYQVVVHVDEAALRGGPGRADLPIDTIKRLACDASVVVVTEDERGNPLDVGRKQRIVSTPLRRALWSRDRGCTFPGCHRALYVNSHHIHHWAQGGDTSLENLTLLCWLHHRLLHEGGYRLKREANGDLRFQRPDGRVIPRGGYEIDENEPDGGDDTSAEGWIAAMTDARDPFEQGSAWTTGSPSAEASVDARVGSSKPSAEVREVRGIYRVACAG